MRKLTILLSVVALMVGLFAAAAYAATIEGTAASEFLQESDKNDTIFARGGADTVDADDFTGDRDVVWGGPGNDTIHTDDGDGLDEVHAGRGFDTCFVDPGDDTFGCNVINPN